MRKLVPLAALVALIGSTACGPSPSAEPAKSPNPAPTPPPKAEVAAPAPAATTAYELSPVPEPADLVAVAGWKNPAALLRTLADCATVDPKFVDMGLDGLSRNVVRELLPSTVDARSLAATVAVDAPVFGVATLDQGKSKRDALGAIAIGLTSLEKARAAVEGAGPLTEIGPGLWRIGGKPKDLTCAIAASAGAAPARLVCGGKEKDVVALAPYLTRTMPTLPAAATDVHAELRLTPIEARLGPEIRQGVNGLPMLAQNELALGDPKFDRALVDAATALSEEAVALVGDLDKLSIDLNVDPQACLRTAGSISFRAKNSWIAGTITERPERQGPPPAIFWRAPKDSGTVFFGRGTDPARYAPILRTLQMLVDGGLTKLNVGSAADRKALVDLFHPVVGKDVATVSASGRFDVSVPEGKKLSLQQEMDARIDAVLGWSLIGYEEGSTAIAKAWKDLAAAYNRKGFQDLFKKALGKKDANLLPKIKVGPGPAGADSLELTISIGGLPAKELELPNATDKDKVSGELHLVLMPDGKDRTWVAIGRRRDELVKRLQAVKSGAPDAGTIASRTDLEPLRRAKLMSGGYLNFGPMLKNAGNSTGLLGKKKSDPSMEKAIKLLGSMPHQGDTPIFVMGTVSGTDAPRAELTIDVPRPAFEDIGYLLKLFFAPKP